MPISQIVKLMETFRQMVNQCIRIDLDNDDSALRKLSSLAYPQLANYDTVSYYKLCAISRAAGILANRKKSIRRGLKPRNPFAKRPLLISCYGFKLIDDVLNVPLGNKQYFDISLNRYVRDVVSDASLRIRSFTVTSDSVSICISKELAET